MSTCFIVTSTHCSGGDESTTPFTFECSGSIIQFMNSSGSYTLDWKPMLSQSISEKLPAIDPTYLNNALGGLEYVIINYPGDTAMRFAESPCV